MLFNGFIDSKLDFDQAFRAGLWLSTVIVRRVDFFFFSFSQNFVASCNKAECAATLVLCPQTSQLTHEIRFGFNSVNKMARAYTAVIGKHEFAELLIGWFQKV